jgi:hypothetical protein
MIKVARNSITEICDQGSEGEGRDDQVDPGDAADHMDRGRRAGHRDRSKKDAGNQAQFQVGKGERQTPSIAANGSAISPPPPPGTPPSGGPTTPSASMARTAIHPEQRRIRVGFSKPIPARSEVSGPPVSTGPPGMTISGKRRPRS